MTTRHRRYLAGFIRARQPRTITTYGVHPLDNSREEILPRYHRDAAADDVWLNPAKSETLRAISMLMGCSPWIAGMKTEPVNGGGELDLEFICQDAGLTRCQTEAVLMCGDGWSVQAIARQLAISRQAVSLRLHNGRRKLIRQVLPLDNITVQRLADGVS